MRLAVVLACGGLVLPCAPRGIVGQGADSLRIEPRRTEIGVFHDGVHLTVTTEVATGTRVAVVVTGPVSDLHLRRQARIWHVFWAPAGAVTFERIPVVYVLQTSTTLEELTGDSALREYGIGYASLQPTVTGEEAGGLLPGLIQLKESEGLYQAGIGALRVGPGTNGQDTVVASIVLPARAPPATYDVTLFGFERGALTTRREGSIQVVWGPVNALVDALAHEHRLLYGILAVGVAVGAGLLVGLLFGTVKGH